MIGRHGIHVKRNSCLKSLNHFITTLDNMSISRRTVYLYNCHDWRQCVYILLMKIIKIFVYFEFWWTCHTSIIILNTHTSICDAYLCAYVNAVFFSPYINLLAQRKPIFEYAIPGKRVTSKQSLPFGDLVIQKEKKNLPTYSGLYRFVYGCVCVWMLLNIIVK